MMITRNQLSTLLRSVALHTPLSRLLVSPTAERPHVASEQLSAYLDDEVGQVEAQAIEAHIAGCDACRARLRQLRGVVHQLSALDRPAPPPWLQAQVRREVVYKRRETPWMRVVRFVTDMPFPRPVASSLSLLLSSGFVVLLFSSMGGNLGQSGLSSLATYPGPVEDLKTDPNFVLMETTIEVAGRTFVREEDSDFWNFMLYETAGQTAAAGNRVWVERGVRTRGPVAQVDARSPQGRAVLAHDPDLGYLLADGSRVVLRYERGTLELRSGA